MDPGGAVRLLTGGRGLRIRRRRLADLLEEPGDELSYTYDFGDDWRHEIRLERILPADSVTAPLITCLTGKGARPPGDCGGAWRYGVLKETLAERGRLLDLLSED